MDQIVSRFAYLFRRYIEQECVPEERNEFLEMVKQDANIPELKNLINTAARNAVINHEINDHRAGELFNNILSAGAGEKVIPMYPPQKKNKIWWAAAAVAVLLAGGAYFTLNNGTKQIAKIEGVNKSIIQDTSAEKNDILPGRNKAILTLADGSSISLDNAQNGTISTQGNTHVLKLNSGKLAYNIINEQPSKIVYNSVSTPKGGQYQLVLSDGSVVWLNAQSSIHFPTSFNGSERKVELTGEAYFEIAKNPLKPFKVEVNEMEVEVLGTHFNINSYADESVIRTTLLEGKIKINKDHFTKILKPAQEAQLSKSGEIKIINDADVAAAVAWKNGKFQFDNTNIYSVMHQISRWYDVDVEYKGNITAHFGGTISRNADLPQVLNMLQLTGEVKFRIEGKKVIVLL